VEIAPNTILRTPIRRIVFGWREPAVFVAGDGAGSLRAAGRDVVELDGFADLVRSVNGHLLG
jgi:diaminohydroxyphosphoribosylaminopyrimidine deaminase/5-amino-6-(5-phosphoribosylamino)uracil reductase